MKPRRQAGSVTNRSGDGAHHFYFPHPDVFSPDLEIFGSARDVEDCSSVLGNSRRESAGRSRRFACRSREVGRCSRRFMNSPRDFGNCPREFVSCSRPFGNFSRESGNSSRPFGNGSREFGRRSRPVETSSREVGRSSRRGVNPSRPFVIRCRQAGCAPAALIQQTSLKFHENRKIRRRILSRRSQYLLGKSKLSTRAGRCRLQTPFCAST